MNAKEFLEDKGIEFDSYTQESVKVLLSEYAEQKLNEYKTKEVQDKVLMLTEKQSKLKSANNLRDFCKYVMHDESDLHKASKAWIKEKLGIDLCYKTNEPCQYGCSGLCKESF